MKSFLSLEGDPVRANIALAMLFDREGSIDLIKEICEENNFSLQDLLPKNQSEFGDSRTPGVIKELRFKNYENRRILKVISLFRALKARETEATPQEKPLEKPPRSSSTPNDLRLQKIHKANALFLQQIEKNLQKLEEKDKRHEQALQKLQERAQKKRTMKEQSKSPVESEYEASSKPLKAPTSVQSIVKHRKLRAPETDDTEAKLLSITKKLEEGSERSKLAKEKHIASASRLIAYHKAQEKKMQMIAQYEIDTASLVSTNYEYRQKKRLARQEIISRSVQKLNQINQFKWIKQEKSKRLEEEEREERERKLIEKEAYTARKLENLKYEKYLNTSISTELRKLKKKNQEENLGMDELKASKYKQKIIEKMKTKQYRAKTPQSRYDNFQDKVRSIKVATEFNYANLRTRLI